MALIQAAERDEARPPVRVVTAGGVALGVPCSRAAFLRAAQQDLGAEWDTWVRRLPRHAKKAAPGNPTEVAARQMSGLLSAAPDSHEPAALTLSDVKLTWGGREDGVHLPAVRIPLNAIVAWWITGGKPFKGPAQWFIGGFFPIPGS